ncbi:hypothetical protein A1O7_06096 [Cladophialophora yegresii CBS 114405]|uniref:Carboxylesterase type B domain-containing protein n=1 Tax=Cladophialophora yegresii CBS 114405 TaxID=1182544 RepID=W9VSX7_9EURO|nr:uncharacterized protein A1O7_06096 [Cladophialophora yegresii CBS 114405]EXJ58668.1 hypothetical protein A1O7_06096 [Cladophialophora yegresii CBS 114405]
MTDSNANPVFGRKPYTGPRYTHLHPHLGSLTGRLIKSPHFPGSSVVQFCSIPFAQVPRRFAPCVVQDNIPDHFDGRPHRDFTQFGAACPQVGATKPSWFTAYGGPLDDDLGVRFDEYTCLSVSISVPETCLSVNSDRKGLERRPVMVYIHGGGAQEGIGHADGLHSNAALAAYSSELSLHAITVNIGYRLNWLGSLVCQDILDEYNADPSVSPHGPFNLTIQDQRAAFAWIHKYIGGFGGDPGNITAFGESAGSIFLIYHICGSPERLFDRVILQSGVIFGQSTFDQKNAEYQSLLKYFGIEGRSASERLEKLRQVPAELLAKYPGQHTLPFVDDVPGMSAKEPLFPRGSPSFSEQISLISSCPWLEDIIIGDDFWEGYVFKDFIRGASPVLLLDTVKSIFPEQLADRLLDAYDLPRTVELAGKVDDNLFWRNLMHFVGDLLFSQPIHNMANELTLYNATPAGSVKKRKIYRYSFGLTNPFPGSDHSFVTGHHFVEILFLFLTLLDRYARHRDRWLEKQAKETAKRWIVFANGKEPWDEYVVRQKAGIGDARMAVCDDIRGWHVKTVSQDREESKSDPWGPRRYDGWAALEDAFLSLKGPEMDVKTYEQNVHMARMRLFGSVVGLPSN